MTLTKDEAAVRLADMLTRIGATVARQYGTDREDCQQEGWVWVLAHKREVKEHQDDPGYLYTAIKRHVSAWARGDRAARGGMDPDSAYHYSRRQIRSLLRTAFTPDWFEVGVDYDKPMTKGGVSDPADLWVMVADVKRGYAQLRQKDQDLLHQILGSPGVERQLIQQASWSYGVAENVLNQRVIDAIGRLQRKIGGPRPRDY